MMRCMEIFDVEEIMSCKNLNFCDRESSASARPSNQCSGTVESLEHWYEKENQSGVCS